MSWLRLDEDVFDDPRVAAITAEYGPIGIAAWIFALTSAKRQNRKGDVELSPIVMARSCGITLDQASAAVTSMVTLGLIAVIPSRANLYGIPNWNSYQPDTRDHEARAEAKALYPGRKPGRPRKVMGGNG